MSMVVNNLLQLLPMMRKDKVYIIGCLIVMAWVGMTYFLFVHRPTHHGMKSASENLAKPLRQKMFKLEQKLNEQNAQNVKLLHEVRAIRDSIQLRDVIAVEPARKAEDSHDFQEYEAPKQDQDFPAELSPERAKPLLKEDIMPILMFACNRPTVKKALDSLLQYRMDKERFPVIVSQDCAHPETKQVLLGYGDEILFIEQPNQRDIPIPKKEIKFKGYFKIARHYGWALNETFIKMGYSQVIIVEDDLEFSPDFYDYFQATLPILKEDSSLYCVSAWNDNGKGHLIDESHPERLYRTDFFGGLGWMLTSKLWSEFSPKWPRSYWDDWVREPAQRKGRACIRPEISRSKTFGKVGVSNGLFYNQHLKFIKLNDKKVDFKSLDLSYLKKANYDKYQNESLNALPVVSIEDIKTGQVSSPKPIRVMYHNKLAFKKIAKVLGIMDDFKSGVPRMAYKGVVSTIFKGKRVYVTPNINWQGYDPTW